MANVPIGCPPAATSENANKILTHAMGYGYCNGKDLRVRQPHLSQKVSDNVLIGCPPAATLDNANKILTHTMGYGYCNGKDLRVHSATSFSHIGCKYTTQT